MIKESAHPHDRGQERLGLPRESVDQIQQLTDKMWYSHGRKKLLGLNYYSPIRDPQKNLLGYATFRRVGEPYRGRLMLTTILKQQMRPRGDNIGAFFDAAVPGVYPDKTPEKFKGFDKVPSAKA